MSSTVETIPLFMEVDLKGMVMQLKEKLQALLSVPEVLKSYGIVEHSQLDLVFTLESASVYGQMLVEVRGGSSSTSDAATQNFSVFVSTTNIASYKFNILVTAEDMFHKLRQSAKNFGEYFSQVTEEGCHYVHDGRILDPDRPMEWHKSRVVTRLNSFL